MYRAVGQKCRDVREKKLPVNIIGLYDINARAYFLCCSLTLMLHLYCFTS